MDKVSYRVPKTKRGQKTFDYIIKTGKKLFAENGYQATSVNDIISKSKVAAGTFYIYFDDKLALYLYLLSEYRKEIRRASRDAVKGLTNRYDIERAGLKAFILYVYKDPLSYKIIWESLFVDFEIFKDYYISFADAYIKQLKHYVDNNQLRSDLDLETTAYVLMGISNFVGLQILFRNSLNMEEVDHIIDKAMQILQQGIFTNNK